MPVVKVDGTDLSYHLISFDKDGKERADDPGGRMSQKIADAVANDDITDVFIFSHGWRGDIPSALRQYKSWVTAMAKMGNDRRRIREARPGFKPLLVGIHWPSEPFGEEDFGDVSFDVTEGAPSVRAEVRRWAKRLGVTGNDEAEDALRTIIESAADDPVPPQLPEKVRDAYLKLDGLLGLGSGGVGAGPDADREEFDPELAYQASFDEEADFGFSEIVGNVLSPLKSLSFWTMKGRGRTVGETGGHSLLKRLMSLPGKDKVRFHLMGHSFGCVMVSSVAVGPPGGKGLPRKVSSLALIQGALSLWSYCKDIPKKPGTPGYFRRLVDVVAGPIVVTTSVHDRAVGTWYPKAAMASRDASFEPGELPTFGGIGSFGIRGPGLSIEDQTIGEANHDYRFKPGRIYNLDGDKVIVGGDKVSGAHSQISVPQVAHAVWQGVQAAP